MKTAQKMFPYLLVLLFTLSLQLNLSHTQQPYLNNKQFDCYNTSNNFTKGYTCNGLETSCQAYLTFRSTATYNSLATIAYLVNSQPSLMTSINNLTDVETIPIDTRIIIPVNCSCSGGRYYQHNSTYILKSTVETYLIVANDTYQGLTTCQAMMEQNPNYDSHNLKVGENLSAPLRCACPTQNQAADGVKYLLTYLVTWHETINEIAELFGVSVQSVNNANELSEQSTIYPFNPILVPLAEVPTKIEESVSPPPANPPEPPAETTPDSNSSKKWIFIGVGIGVAVLLIILGLVCWFLFYKKDKPHKKPIPVDPIVHKASESSDFISLPNRNSGSVLSSGIRDAVETLTVYKFEDLQEATESFSERNRIQGSVYRGKFKGDDAAVKVLKFDTSSEINTLRQINHSNIIRLSGFCVHEGYTYLVYEYAENGSLSDWLHSKKDQTSPLSWKLRVQIAYNVADALNYVHNYMNPPYIHKNLKTSNVLLDHNFRAKIANFGLARMVDENAEGGLQLTRHVVGTQGYMAPEYIENGLITPKMDVFAFGVVMLELLSGKEAAGDSKRGEELLSIAINRVLDGDNVREKLQSFMDSCLNNEYPLDLAFTMAQLAKRCVATDMNSRPAMTEVLVTLSKIHSSSLDWDPSDELDSSRSASYGR